MAAIVSPSNAPRDLEGLKALTRSVRLRIAHQMDLFKNQDEENAYNGADDDQQAGRLLVHLQMLDASKSQQPTSTDSGANMSQMPPVVPPGVPPGFPTFSGPPGQQAAPPQQQQPQQMSFPTQPQAPAGFPGGLPQMVMPSGPMPAQGAPAQAQGPQNGPSPFSGFPGFPQMGAPGAIPGGVPGAAMGAAPGSMPMSPAMQSIAASLPGTPITPQGQQIQQQLRPQAAPPGLPSEVVEGLSKLTALIGKTGEANANMTADVYKHLQAIKSDLNILMRIQIFSILMHSQQFGMPQDQMFGHISQFVQNFDEKLLESLRNISKSMPGKATG